MCELLRPGRLSVIEASGNLGLRVGAVLSDLFGSSSPGVISGCVSDWLLTLSRDSNRPRLPLTLLLSMNAQSVRPALLHVVQGNPVILPSHLTRLSLQFLQAIIDLFLLTFTAVAAVELLAVLPGATTRTHRFSNLDDVVSTEDKYRGCCAIGEVLEAEADLPQSPLLRGRRRYCPILPLSVLLPCTCPDGCCCDGNT